MPCECSLGYSETAPRKLNFKCDFASGVYETVKVRTCRPSVNDTTCSEPVDPNILLSQSSACFLPQSKGQQQETFGDVLEKSFIDFWEGQGRGKLSVSNICGSGQEKKEMKKRQRPFKGCLLDVIEDHVRLTARSISQLDDGGGEAPAFLVSCALDVGKHDFQTMPKKRPSTASSNMGAKALRQIHLQLVELAFAEHPILPLVVSKTSFMQHHRQESLEPWIFDLVLTEGLARLSRSQRGSDVYGSLPSSEEILQQAASAMLSVSATQPSLSIALGLLLTAWRLLLNGCARRASIMLGQCCVVVNALLDLCSQSSDGSITLTAATGTAAATAMVTVTEVRINGIDVAQLELELLGNIYWIEQSLLLWMSQSLDVGVPGYSSPTSPAALPPLDEHSSLVFELDYTSGHFTTLSNLARGIQQLRALAHVDCLAMSLDKRYRRCACKLADGSSVDRDAFKAVQDLIPKIKDEVQNALPLSHASKHPYNVVKPAYLSFLLCASLVKSPVAEFDLTVGNASETRKTVLEVGEHLAKCVMEHGGDDEKGSRRRIVPLTASYFIEALSILFSQQTAQEWEMATIQPTLAALWVFLKNDETRAVKGKVQKVARRLQLDLSVAAAQMKIHQQLFVERGRCQRSVESKSASSNTSSRASVSEEEEDSEEDDIQEPGMKDPTAVQASFTFRKRKSGPTSAWSPFSSASSSSSSTTSCVAMPFASMRQTSLLPAPYFSLPTPVPARTTVLSDVNQQRHLRDTHLPSTAWASTPGRTRSSIGSQPAHYLLHTRGNGTPQTHGVLQDFAEVLNRATLAPLSNKRKSPSMSDDEDEDALGGGDDEDEDEEEGGKARQRD